MARLILEHDKEVLKDYPFRKTSMTIGRHRGNTIVLDNPGVSGYHARIDKSGPDFILTDLQSTNGTLVNGNKVVTWKLTHGDKIRIEDHVLLFVGTEKAKAEAEQSKITLNKTMIVATKPEKRRLPPKRPVQGRGHRPREVEVSRPYRNITSVFIAIIILAFGGWLTLSHGPFLIKSIFEQTPTDEISGKKPKITGSQITDMRKDGPAAVTKKIPAKPGAHPEVEGPGRSLRQGQIPTLEPSEEWTRPPGKGGGQPASKGPTRENELDESRFKLDGIVWSSDPKHSFAVINGFIVRVGASIEGVKVTEIGNDYVILLSPDRDSKLRLTYR